MHYSEKEVTYAFNSLDRSTFMDTDKESADIDKPFSIGHGQTISQPSLVLKMTHHLDLEADSKVLEIGTGSGFQTALLAELARSVYTVERIDALSKRAKDRLDQEYTNIQFKSGDGSNGWAKNAPYDRIIVTAASKKMPEALVEQLAPGGKMIIPVGNFFGQELKLVEKDADNIIYSSLIDYVMFVELVEGEGK